MGAGGSRVPRRHRAGLGFTLALVAAVGLPAFAAESGPTAAQAAAARDMVERQQARLLDLLHGEWGNMDQFFFQQRLGVAEEARRALVHLSVTPGEAGGRERPVSVLRVSAGGRQPRLLEQWTLTHEIEPGSGLLRSLAAPADARVGDAGACVIHWQMVGEYFRGRQQGRCPTWGDSAGATALVLATESLWALPADGGSPAVSDDYVRSLRMRRAQRFTCRINLIRRDAGQMDFGQLRVQRFDTWTELSVHDQGGEVWIETQEDPPRQLGLRLHHVVWPFGESEPSRGLFLLDAAQPDDGRGIGYVSTSPDSRRIAFSNRAVSASCFMDTE